MSEAGNNPTFNPEDIPPNASENDAFGPQTAIMALADELSYVDPELFKWGESDIHYLSELEYAAKHLAWLTEADELFRDEKYAECARLLGRVAEDIEHAGRYYPETALDAVKGIIRSCYKPSHHARGKIAVANVIALPDTHGMEDCPQTPLAS